MHDNMDDLDYVVTFSIFAIDILPNPLSIITDELDSSIMPPTEALNDPF